MLNSEACVLGSLLGGDPLEQRLLILLIHGFLECCIRNVHKIIIYECSNVYRKRITEKLKTLRINQTL